MGVRPPTTRCSRALVMAPRGPKSAAIGNPKLAPKDCLGVGG